MSSTANPLAPFPNISHRRSVLNLVCLPVLMISLCVCVFCAMFVTGQDAWVQKQRKKNGDIFFTDIKCTKKIARIDSYRSNRQGFADFVGPECGVLTGAMTVAFTESRDWVIEEDSGRRSPLLEPPPSLTVAAVGFANPRATPSSPSPSKSATGSHPPSCAGEPLHGRRLRPAFSPVSLPLYLSNPSPVPH